MPEFSRMKNSIQILFLLITVSVSAQNFTIEEQNLILNGDVKTKLKVILNSDSKELKILKSISKDIDPKANLVDVLAERMYLSMRDPENLGVGIAAPQVGINRNIIWVQRFDKAGEPFELYYNPKIIWSSEELQKGTEGCLSIPEVTGEVWRNLKIKLSYQNKSGAKEEALVEGFTAVIFQHEIDHLNGLLFTDRLFQQENDK